VFFGMWGILLANELLANSVISQQYGFPTCALTKFLDENIVTFAERDDLVGEFHMIFT
jgi:hypothetical protein